MSVNVERILYMRRAGFLAKEIAAECGCSIHTVNLTCRDHGCRKFKKKPLPRKEIPSQRTRYRKPLRGPNYQEQRYVVHLPREPLHQ